MKANRSQEAARRIQNNIAGAIDEKGSIQDMLTSEERKALRIACGLDRPTKNRSAAWARTVCRQALRDLAETSYLHKIAKRAVEIHDLERIDPLLMQFVVEKPKEKRELDMSQPLQIVIKRFSEDDGDDAGR